MASNRDLVPIIQSGAANCFGVETKSGRTNDVQIRVRSGAQPGDIAGVLWDLWFNQRNVEHDEARVRDGEKQDPK